MRYAGMVELAGGSRWLQPGTRGEWVSQVAEAGRAVSVLREMRCAVWARTACGLAQSPGEGGLAGVSDVGKR